MTTTAMMLPDLDWEELAPYWAGLREHQVRLPRCDNCGRYVWYPQPICATCHADSLRWVTIQSRGTLFSWTVIRYAFHPMFADALPLHLGMVEPVDAPGVRLIGEIVNPAAAAIGRGVTFVFEDDQPEGITWLKFRISEES